MVCENCLENHDGSYGSGRFCSSGCARGFSTKEKRTEINQTVSAKLSGVDRPSRRGFKHSDETKESLRQRKLENTIRKIESTPFIDLTFGLKRKVVLQEQNEKCLWCGVSSIWNGKPLTLQIDHIDGVRSNNQRDNLRALCPNCHTQTPTYGSKNMKPESRVKMAEVTKYMRELKRVKK